MGHSNEATETGGQNSRGAAPGHGHVCGGHQGGHRGLVGVEGGGVGHVAAKYDVGLALD